MKLPLLIIILIVISSFGQFGRFELDNGLVLHLTDFLVGFVVVIWFIEKMEKGIAKIFQPYVFTKPLFVFVLICLLSLLLNYSYLKPDELLFSIFYLIRWTSYALIFFIINSFNDKNKQKIINTLILSQLIFIIIGYIQYIFYPNLRNLYYAGWDDHLYRWFSTYLDPNFAAAQLNLCLFLLMFKIFSKENNNFFNKKYLILFYLFAFVALLLTYSRSGYLMFVAGTALELWLLGKRNLIGAFMSMLLIGILLIPKDLKSSGVELWRTASIFARTESLKSAVQIIKDQPIFGIGFNAYRYAQKRYGFIEDETWKVTHSGAGTDNSFLFILATTGIVGFSVYLYLWLSIIRVNIHRSIKYDSWSIVILASIAGLFINSFFINSLFYPNFLLWLWIILGLRGEMFMQKV